jgi:hypothetical protein
MWNNNIEESFLLIFNFKVKGIYKPNCDPGVNNVTVLQ